MSAGRRFDLIAFDVDGTLIDGPDGETVWEVLNRRFTGDSGMNVERLRRYRSGELSYADWVALDVGGWQAAGARRDDLIAGFAPLSPVPGATEALRALKETGARLVAISGTLDLLLATLLPDAPFDEVYANHVGFDAEGRISHWRATPFDMEGKGRLLRALLLRERVRKERSAFVGNSANDLWIAREAGFTVAFNPLSEELERAADAVVRARDFRATLEHLI